MTTNRRHRPAAGDGEVQGMVRDYKEIAAEYRYDASIFSDEPQRTARVKWIVENRLTPVDRTLLLLYADCQSLRKLSERMHISHTLLGREIKRIRAQVLEEYNKLDADHIAGVNKKVKQ